MDSLIKRTAFGGYKKSDVDDRITQLEAQLQKSLRNNALLTGENNTLRSSVTTLEAANRSLAEEADRRQADWHSQLEELRALYRDSSAARHEYDQYLNTVGQVYMVACESAENIVHRSETHAQNMLESLSITIQKSHEDAGKAVRSARDARDRLASSLPALMENLQFAFQEIDEFLLVAQSIPEACDLALDMPKAAVLDMQQELHAFRQRSGSLVAESSRPAACAVLDSPTYLPDREFDTDYTSPVDASTTDISVKNVPVMDTPNDRPTESPWLASSLYSTLRSRASSMEQDNRNGHQQSLVDSDELLFPHKNLQSSRPAQEELSFPSPTMVEPPRAEMLPPAPLTEEKMAVQPLPKAESVPTSSFLSPQLRANVKELLDKYSVAK